jgi:hypothetical protein
VKFAVPSSSLTQQPPKSIAKREKCSVQKVTMTISLAFLAPDLVKAAIEGRLPMAWSYWPCRSSRVTEGFGTLDLTEAKALLDDWRLDDSVGPYRVHSRLREQFLGPHSAGFAAVGYGSQSRVHADEA